MRRWAECGVAGRAFEDRDESKVGEGVWCCSDGDTEEGALEVI